MIRLECWNQDYVNFKSTLKLSLDFISVQFRVAIQNISYQTRKEKSKFTRISRILRYSFRTDRNINLLANIINLETKMAKINNENKYESDWKYFQCPVI